MTFWSAVVIIVFIVCLSGIITSYISAHKAQGKSRDSVEKRIDELEAELSERVQTLERIVTDERSDLRRQFDDLEKSA